MHLEQMKVKIKRKLAKLACTTDSPRQNGNDLTPYERETLINNKLE